MRGYRYGDLHFSAPEAWADVSVVTTGSASATMTLVRERRQGRKTLEAFAKRRLPALRKSMKKHRLVAKGPVELRGTQAYRMEHRYVSNRVPVHQLQYFIESGDDTIAVLSLTCAMEALDEHRPLFESIAASVRREETR
jgi:hypothetical protein